MDLLRRSGGSSVRVVQRLSQPAARDLRTGADRGDAALARRDPSWAAGARADAPPAARRSSSPRPLELMRGAAGRCAAAAGPSWYPEQRGLHLAQPFPIALDADRRVVVEKSLR